MMIGEADWGWRNFNRGGGAALGCGWFLPKNEGAPQQWQLEALMPNYLSRFFWPRTERVPVADPEASAFPERLMANG